ncbi:hypothetical protein J6590_056679 [Homalodisca vitripennis]|nr:hypothetical protein J6590_056679 [Homalodisca vitripennis]
MVQFLNGWKVPASRLTDVCLQLTGVCPTKPSKGSSILVMKLFVMLTSLVQAIISLSVHWNDNTEVFRVVNDVSAITYGTSLVFTFGLYHDRIEELLTMLQQGLYQYSTPLSDKQHVAKRDATMRVKIVERVFIISSILGTFFFFISPMIFGIINFMKDSHEKIPLPLSPWFPFDIDSVFLYLTIYTVEMMISLIIIIYHISWQCSLYTSILCLQGEMRILDLAFMNIPETAKVMTSRASHRGDVQYYNNCCLKECIQHHQKILQ